jgi:hypothetical protein
MGSSFQAFSQCCAKHRNYLKDRCELLQSRICLERRLEGFVLLLREAEPGYFFCSFVIMSKDCPYALPEICVKVIRTMNGARSMIQNRM